MRTVVLNGVNYFVPDKGDTGYGANLTSYLVALSTAFPQLGGLATLTQDLDFGASFGPKAIYFKSRTANPALSGILRLAAADAIAFRNQANSADVSITLDASNRVTLPQETWQAPTLAGTWANVGGANLTAGYFKDSQGFVHLRGLVSTGTVNTTITTLPAGYRPSATCTFPITANGVFALLTVASTGVVVTVGAGSATNTSLDGVTFDTR